MKIADSISRRSFVSIVAGSLLSPLAWSAVHNVPSLLDHFILGCDDLDRGIDFVEKHTGVRAAPGGVHPGRGTRNALLSFGDRRYLEIMAPDPAQSVPLQIPRLRTLKDPRIVGWAAHVDDMQKLAERLRKSEIQFDGPRPGSRQRPDGKILQWQSLTLKDDHAGMLPFFIEWNSDSIHPSVDAPNGCSLTRFSASTPETEDLLHAVSEVGLDLNVDINYDQPILKAEMVGPRGELSATS